jgi:hypothetical protein
MAFSPDTYRALNGFPEVERGENAALVTSARYHGFRARRDPTVVVYTSTRRQGRVGTADLSMLLSGCRNGEAFATRAVPIPDNPVPLPLAAAERKLARAIRHRRG